MPKRSGPKSEAQTPAPSSERVHGSKINPKGSASSEQSADAIYLSAAIIEVLERKVSEFNSKHPKNKVSLSILKAVFRRGAGAYSSSHRPTISGGRPNSRSAWAYARVNAFLRKKAGGEAKKSYVQDDDLMEEGGQIGKLLAPNGNPSKLTPEQYKLVRTPSFKAWFGDWEHDPKNASKVIDENGEPLVVYHYARKLKYEDDKFFIFRTNKELGSHFGTKQQTRYIGGRFIFDYKTGEYREKTDDLNHFRYYAVFLKIINPHRLKDKGFFWEEQFLNSLPNRRNEENKWENKYFYSQDNHLSDDEKIKFIAQKRNIDGVVYLNRAESKTTHNIDTSDYDHLTDEQYKEKFIYPEDSWIAFYPNQIKLADGNNTTFDPSNPDIRYAEGGQIGTLLAPNGNPSKLTPEQYKLVRTPSFKAWFGDWEHDPKNASKVVDLNGEPMIVYHSSYEDDINVFDTSRGEYSMFGPGTYFTNKKNEYVGKRRYPVFLSLKNPIIIDAKNKLLSYAKIDELLENTDISVIIKNPKHLEKYSRGRIYFIVKHPNEIKLADATNVTFDADNPDIRFAEGGETERKIALPDTQSSFLPLREILEKQGYELKVMDQSIGKLSKIENMELGGMTEEEYADNDYILITEFRLKKVLIDLGYDVSQGAYSKTDYGYSKYFNVNFQNRAYPYPLKVRISDHSVENFERLINEIHVRPDVKMDVVIKKAVKDIDLRLKPELFYEREFRETSVQEIIVGEGDINYETDKVISFAGISKRGSKKYLIERKIMRIKKVAEYK